MKKMNHLFKAFLLALMALPLTAMADETKDVQYLILSQNNAKVAEFELSTLPVLSISSDSLVVVASGDSLVVPLEGLSYAFETRQVTTGIDNVRINDNRSNESFAFSNGTVMGMKEGAKVGVYSINGLKVSEVTVSADGKASLNLSNLPKGVYIIRTPARSFKVINR